MKEGKVALSPFLPLREAEEPAAIIIVVPAALSDEQTRKSERLSLSPLQLSHNIARCHESTRVVGVRCACGGRPSSVIITQTCRSLRQNSHSGAAQSSRRDEEGEGDSGRAITKLACCGKKRAA